ncbi:MAG: hypothetical protein AMJ56_13055 [Anaerolineae bacterium SG8_19]|nr:MAG: hypothetical protein AMJ56_13055 [Anaerolineae bacterium SG8_19]
MAFGFDKSKHSVCGSDWHLFVRWGCYIGRIGRDQVEDYARRKGMDVTTAEKWLAPVLGFDA